MDTYKNTIDTFSEELDTNCNDDFGAFMRALNACPPQYVRYAERKLIEKDPTGKLCYYFARDVENADIPLLQQAVIDKDTTGEWCYLFASDVAGADVPQLQQPVIEKDPTGEWCYRFAHTVTGADVPLLQRAVIEKDPTGEWCYWLRLSHQEENLMEELSL